MLINFAKSTGQGPRCFINTEQIAFARIYPSEPDSTGQPAAICLIMGKPSCDCEPGDVVFGYDVEKFEFQFANDEDCKSAWEQLKALMDYHEIS